jgi:hypothetical protein
MISISISRRYEPRTSARGFLDVLKCCLVFILSIDFDSISLCDASRRIRLGENDSDKEDEYSFG